MEVWYTYNHMNNNTLSSKEIFSFGFKNAKKYFWSFFVFIIVYYGLNLIFNWPFREDESMSLLQGLGLIVNMVLSVYLMMSLYSAVLKIARGEDVTMKTFFTWPENGFRVIWTSIVSALVMLPPLFIGGLIWGFSVAMGNMAVAIIGGIIALASFVVAIYLMIRVSFSKYYTLETGAWAIASIKKSFEMTKGRVGRLIVLGIISCGIVLLGFIALGIGLLWAFPTVFIAWMYIYVLLMGGKQEVHVESVAPIVPQMEELTPSTIEQAPVIPTMSDNTTI